MKKASVLLLGIFIFFVVYGPSLVSAHELATSGTLSAVLHVDPDDHVVSGGPSPFALEYVDTADVFDATKCDCVLAATLAGKTVATAQVTSVEAAKVAGTITFPKPGNYQVTLTGKPKAGSNFASFSIHFPEAVTAPKQSALGKTFVVGTIALVAVILVAGGIILRRTKKLTKPAA